ncbi:non-oxidative hydroxyarylic acid decarboxylases subunit D [Flexivirga meconopsidis]|uniref:non-oxidative hydroxyarylic acid decarboxylases subunit D n=1 Tax=Flexivirga meconopsidis TaxID=2977121 RepID=UPI00223EF264|nr:non-oxidative hydroxyarylic acid decarboxylases subunit D [Flexivirga meconopsidis]
MNTDNQPCPRCPDGTATVATVSPSGNIWTVYMCRVCHFSWRSTEPKRRTESALYPEAFRLTAADMAAAPDVPAVPPLRRNP